MEDVTNEALFTELKERGFYVSKVQQETSVGLDYIIVSAEPVKVREVVYTDRKDWSVNYGFGAD